MGFKDKFNEYKNKAEEALGEHKDESAEGVDKAANMADEKTDHKHTEKIDEGAEKAKGAVNPTSDDV